jgi:CheY-like chemotaxis protein
MARVLICEPHADISALLELVVRRLGHEPELYAGDEVSHIGIDAAVIEPGEAIGRQLARRLRGQDVPVLFTSIYAADPELTALAPAAYLVKPFPLYALERALELALPTEPAAAPAAEAVVAV